MSITAAEIPTWTIKRPSWIALIIYLTLATVGALLVLYAWNLPPFAGPIQRTEDAYVQGHTTLLAPQVNGYVETVAVNDFAQVKEGDLLFEIDSRRLKQAVSQAQANLDAKLAALAKTSRNLPKAWRMSIFRWR